VLGWTLAAGVLLSAAWPGGPTAPDRCSALAPGQLVNVRIELDGRPAPLFRAADGSGRYYVEAHRGRAYAVTLGNRSGRRLGVELRVDGLDVITGDRVPAGERGRLYVLPPRGETTIRGWRTSLEAVRRFEFVDEASSYAARSSKWNPKLGWIEVTAYRERRPRHPVRILDSDPADTRSGEREAAPAPDASESRAPRDRALRAHPGTGWGRALEDRAVLVSFDPEPAPAETVILRYEYAPALRALGVLPWWWKRLAERERGRPGFAQPPDR
jgi:hypothetical protein